MEEVRRDDGDGGEKIGGGGEDGGGGEGIAPPGQPLPLLHPGVASARLHRERHIVAWTQKEDDLLREQVGIHGPENWTTIATHFKDKTARQCRRRWFSYLNTECKKGSWSMEEDMILCEAQKIFGNRWTEIAKVVSGRTDNAVKNRFTTLCKKRAKNEATSREHNSSYPPSSNENFVHENGCVTDVTSESSTILKKIRYQIASQTENDNMKNISLGEHKIDMKNARPPLAMLVPNCDNVGGLPDHDCNANKLKPVQNDENTMNNKFQGSLVRRNDRKISALMEEVELLGSLGQKVCTNSNENPENTWKEHKDYLIQNGESGPVSSEVSQVDFLVDDVKDLTEDSKSSSVGSHPKVRQSDIHEHPHLSSEHGNGNGSINDSDVPTDPKELHAENSAMQHDSKAQSLSEGGAHIGGSASQELELPSGSVNSSSAPTVAPCGELKENDGIVSISLNAVYSSPLQTMPIFRPFSEGNPSPKFSASERQFLLSALGLSSSSPNMDHHSQQPSCKRALLHNL